MSKDEGKGDTMMTKQISVEALKHELHTERGRHLEILENYQCVVDAFLDVAQFAEGDYNGDEYFDATLGAALRASWSLPMAIDTARSIHERG